MLLSLCLNLESPEFKELSSAAQKVSKLCFSMSLIIEISPEDRRIQITDDWIYFPDQRIVFRKEIVEKLPSNSSVRITIDKGQIRGEKINNSKMDYENTRSNQQQHRISQS